MTDYFKALHSEDDGDFSPIGEDLELIFISELLPLSDNKHLK